RSGTRPSGQTETRARYLWEQHLYQMEMLPSYSVDKPFAREESPDGWKDSRHSDGSGADSSAGEIFESLTITSYLRLRRNDVGKPTRVRSPAREQMAEDLGVNDYESLPSLAGAWFGSPDGVNGGPFRAGP